MKKIRLILCCLLVLGKMHLSAQPCECVNTLLWSSITLPAENGVTNSANFIWAGDIVALNAAVEGRTYRVGSSISTDYLSIYTDNPATDFVDCGTTDLTFSSPTTGTIYLHVISEQGCGADVFDRTISAECLDCDPAGPPANNLCAGAIELDASNQNACGTLLFGSTQLATNSGETAPTCAASGLAGGDVWYKFVAQGENYQVSFSNVMGFNGSTGNMQYALYSGSCGSLVQVQCGGLRWYGLDVGQTYHLRVWTGNSSSNQYSNFNICIFHFEEPAHNTCAEAAVIIPAPTMSCEALQNLSTQFASNSGESGPSCFVNALVGGDVWVRFTATASKHILLFSNLQHFDQGGVSTNMILALYTGACGSLTQLDCGNAILNTNRVFSDLNPGQDYYVRIWTSNVSSSQYTIFDVCLVTPLDTPSNDLCADATVVIPSDALICDEAIAGSTSSATNSMEAVPSCIPTGLVSGDIWYSFTATHHTHRVQLTNVNHFGGFSWVTTALYAGNCGQLTELACINQSSNTRDFDGLTPGTTYFLRIWTESNLPDHFITFDLCIGTFPPPAPNQECEDAIHVGVPSSIDGYNFSASNNEIGFECSGGLGTNHIAYSGVWYSIMGDGGEITVSTCNSADFPTRLAVFTGSCSSLVCVAGNNVGEGCTGGSSQLTFHSSQGVLYYIVVSSTSSISGRGTFTLNISTDLQGDCPIGPAIYVQSGSNGTGASWADALGSLQDALELACMCSQISEIWVAQGTYYPDEGVNVMNNDREATFQLCNGLAVYGGFAGFETDLSQRDWEANKTVLSGDIGQDDVTDSNDITNHHSDIVGENSFSVVTSSGTDNTALIDGFVITAGHANDSESICFFGGGGGIYNNNGNVTILNNAFVGNFANGSGGGAIYNENSTSLIENNRFYGNKGTDGGAIFNNSSAVVVLMSSFENNEASSGGAVYDVNSETEYLNCVFSTNHTSNNGGAIYASFSELKVINALIVENNADNFGGGIYTLYSPTELINSTISENNAELGGGSYSQGGLLTVVNSIIWQNYRDGNPNQIGSSTFWNGNPMPVFTNSLIANSGGSSAWVPNTGTDGGNNIDEDPLFQDAENVNYRLDACSPAVDAGTPDPSGLGLPEVDLDGNPRIVNEIIDLGAYEYNGSPCGGELVLGDANCDGDVNILDVVTIINHILGTNPEPFCYDQANVNGDEVIDILDVVNVINLILNAGKSNVVSQSADIYLEDNLIRLSSDGTLTGVQFELYHQGKSDLTLELIPQEFTLAYHDHGGRLSGVIMHIENKTFKKGLVDLIRISQHTHAEWGYVMASNIDAKRVNVNKHQDYKGFSFFVSPNPAYGEVDLVFELTTEAQVLVRLTDMRGNKVKTITNSQFASGKHSIKNQINTIASGVYILSIEANPLDSSVKPYTEKLRLVVVN